MKELVYIDGYGDFEIWERVGELLWYRTIIVGDQMMILKTIYPPSANIALEFLGKL